MNSLATSSISFQRRATTLIAVTAFTTLAALVAVGTVIAFLAGGQ